ncbi:MAG: RNA methyltransferase [Candidatus Omnitrophica bacterium]|nr:RNA methyltransferase [Candidatus Omnitrophota bacterium]
MEKITSLQNSGIKRVVRLRTKKTREAKGLTLVEGIREVRQALKAGLRFAGVYVCREGTYHCPDDLIAELEARQIRVFDCVCSVYGKMAYGDRKEGVLALVDQPDHTLAGLKLSEKPLIVVMERVEKPGNLGAVLRTCDGAGVEALLVCDELTDIYNPNVVRSSLGAAFTVPTVMCSSREALEFLRARGVCTVAAVVQASEEYFKKDLAASCAIVLGSEQDGLSDFWLRNADVQVRIPMKGSMDSLNVSVSAAIMVYEAVRQRWIGKDS